MVLGTNLLIQRRLVPWDFVGGLNLRFQSFQANKIVKNMQSIAQDT